MLKIGVCSLQGDVSEHEEALARAGATPMKVRTPEHLKKVDGFIIPGGESTTIGKLMQQTGLLEEVRAKAHQGFPIWGTCAGMVLLAKKGGVQVKKTRQPLLGLMDYEVERNAFGRQRESFEKEIELEHIGRFHAVFIRAPSIKKVWGKCEPLAVTDNTIVAARQENMLATAFHPELTEDERVHAYFLEMVKKAKNSKV